MEGFVKTRRQMAGHTDSDMVRNMPRATPKEPILAFKTSKALMAPGQRAPRIEGLLAQAIQGRRSRADNQ